MIGRILDAVATLPSIPFAAAILLPTLALVAAFAGIMSAVCEVLR